MEENYLELSRDFWDNYKLFLKEELSLTELKRFLVTVDDVIFYHEECDTKCDVVAILKVVMKKSLDTFINEFLLKLAVISNLKRRKGIARKILIIFLGNYLCVAKGKAKAKCKEIMIHFSSSFDDTDENDDLDRLMRNVIGLMVSSYYSKKDMESIGNLVLFKFICLYACLAVSDRDGAIKCRSLGKELSENWNKSTPEVVTLACLRKISDGLKQQISEIDLLEKFSF